MKAGQRLAGRSSCAGLSPANPLIWLWVDWLQTPLAAAPFQLQVCLSCFPKLPCILQAMSPSKAPTVPIWLLRNWGCHGFGGAGAARGRSCNWEGVERSPGLAVIATLPPNTTSRLCLLIKQEVKGKVYPEGSKQPFNFSSNKSKQDGKCCFPQFPGTGIWDSQQN